MFDVTIMQSFICGPPMDHHLMIHLADFVQKTCAQQRVLGKDDWTFTRLYTMRPDAAAMTTGRLSQFRFSWDAYERGGAKYIEVLVVKGDETVAWDPAIDDGTD